MRLQYSYHSEHNADKQDRWIHFVLFLGALILLFAGAQQLYLHFTAWTAAEESHNWNHLILGLVYLVVGALLTWFGFRLKNASGGATDRYVRVTDEHLIWNLSQVEGERSIALAEIVKVERPNVRDLNVILASEQVASLPIFLIANEEKQEELVSLLEGVTSNQS